MGAYNFNLVKDELSLPAWLAIGAAAQIGVTLIAPQDYVLVPAAVAIGCLALNFAGQFLGLLKNTYLKGVTFDRHSVLFPEDDGSRPEEMGSKPVAMFMIGIRSNHPLGRLHPTYRKLNHYMDEIYADAEDNRLTNGYLGRTPDMIPVDFSQNNTLTSISYWKSIEELEAFARRPVHLKGLKFLVTALYSDKPHDLGVIHEVLVCPPGHWEAVYSNVNPWGFGGTKWPSGKNRSLQGPIIERDNRTLNGMWGRMGNKLKQAGVDEKLAEIEKMNSAA